MRSFRLPLVLLAILASIVLVWAARRPLSEAAVGRWFASQGVEARYRITALSPTAVSLDDVSLGPSARPDFTAARIDATVSWSPLRPRIATVRLVRPELHATLSRNGISLGSLDRLLPAPARPARALPDVDLTLIEGRLQVATPAGSFSGSVDGAGRLGGGFRGSWRVAPTVVAAGGCTATLTDASIALATARDAVRIMAAGTLPRIVCSQGSAEAVGWHVSATLPQALDRYSAQFGGQAARWASGDYRGQAVTLRGDAAAAALDGPVNGRASAQAGGVRGRSFAAARVAAAGPYRFDARTGAGDLAAAVEVTGASAVPVTGPMRRVSRQLAGTLAQPLYDALLARGSAAARSFDASASLALRRAAGGISLDITALTARAASGAQLRQTGNLKVLPDSAAVAGGVILWGGGLPSMTVTGSGSADAGGKVEGTAELIAAPWAVPGGRIDALRIGARSDGARTRLTGLVRVSGALGGGVTAQRLGLPIQAEIDRRGGVTVGRQCLSIDWTGLARDALSFGPGTAQLCPAGDAIGRLAGGRASGRAVLAPLNLRGRSGETPLSVTSAALPLTLSGTTARPRLTMSAARFGIGYGELRAAAVFDGTLDVAGATGAGRIAAACLESADLPVAVTAGSGRWRFAGARLELTDASARVTDRVTPARFEPLRIDGASAVLVNGQIDARGSGRLASTGARLFGFTATHSIASGRGTAAIETALHFGPELQPYQITEALRGVIDNVAGPISGSGQLAWTGSALTSRGTVAIDHVSLATASLGPIDDIAGSLAFDDLLALTTPPGQMLTIKRINPGVAVDDGVVRFRMLGPDAAMIESIVWPYAGGTLTLARVTVRAGDLTRSFTLTVDGLDAAQFLQKFDIKDLNVTGTFDGRLPLIFADGKGRIAAGTLVARAGGGLVQYVGAVGGEDLGAGARLAFDALRRLRYHSLALDLDGDLDGELVTQLRFAGTNETATTLGGGPLPIRATGLPFRFNVTVRAPFRALLGTASSFSDVRPLIRPAAAGVQPQ